MNDSAKPVFLNRTLGEWLFSLPIFLLLLLTLIIGTGEMFHGQLLRTGEKIFGNPEQGVQYFLLRADPTQPACDPNASLDAEVQKQIASQKAGNDELGDLFGDAVIDEAAVRQSVEQNLAQCKEKHEMYGKIKENITPAVKAYRAVETGFFAIFHFGTENRPLILLLMVLIAAIHTTMGEHHIALRPPSSRKDFRVYATAMIIGNVIMTISCVYYLKLQQQSGVPIDKPVIYYLWIALFAAITLISVKQLIWVPERATNENTSLGKSLLSIPLFAVMAVIAGGNFIAQGHWAGLAIYLNQMMELSGVFLNLALYIWAGMLLKQTRVVDNFLDILRPWKLSPEFLTYLILLLAALPTAYTGASGIFVIAAGAIIYHEVRYAGGRPQFALAATAMSGSLGVVLAPCLLVVVIAALNKQVTTAELYGWGFWVFLLSSTMFLVVSQVVRRQKVDIEKPSVALPASFRAFGPVAPYIVIAVGVAWFYGAENYGLNTKLNEFTAPVILPVILLAIVFFDKMRRVQPKATLVPGAVEERRIGFEGAVRLATNETIAHIGALIILMALSTCTGGVIERSGIMESVPHSFDNIWLAMGLLVALLVFVGMIMDPFGAVILVSATIAPVAYNNGINPIHFWMVVLAAFELGYLSPPVALNQLLARQVVGEEEIAKADAEAASEKSFYYRYERWILPVVVMATALLLVAFGPLVYQEFFR